MIMNFKSLALLSGALLFAACGDNTVTNVNDEAKEKGDISFLILDRTGAALDSVTVSCDTDGSSNLTDESGYAVWTNNEIGSQVFTISKKGYAPMRVVVDVEEQGKGNVARVPNVTKKVVMHKLGATIQGTLLYRDISTNNLSAASKVQVFLKFSNANFTTSEVSLKTDENGEYKFEDLPEGVNILISVPQTTIENHLYNLTEDLNATIEYSKDKQDLGIATLSLVAKTVTLVKSNLTEIDTTSSVNLTFSADLNKDSVSFNHWTVKDNNDNSVLFTVSLKDNRTVVIKPSSGKWANGKKYSVSGSVYTSEGSNASISQTFSVGKSSNAVPGQVSSLKATLTGSYLELSWKAPSGSVSGYYIYYKTNSMSDYLHYTSTSSTYFEDSESDFQSKTSDTSVKFIVLPYNAAGTADVTKAEAISYTFSN